MTFLPSAGLAPFAQRQVFERPAHPRDLVARPVRVGRVVVAIAGSPPAPDWHAIVAAAGLLGLAVLFAALPVVFADDINGGSMVFGPVLAAALTFYAAKVLRLDERVDAFARRRAGLAARRAA